MPITPGEARVGYGLYLAANADISKEALQEQFYQLNVGLLSPRMFQHYRSLYAAGYDHYIAINRFDILQGAEPYTNDSANSRYSFSEFGEAVRVTVMRSDPFDFLATTTRVSDAGLALDISDEPTASRLARGINRVVIGEFVRVDFLDGTRPTVDGRLVDRPEKYPTDERWMLEVEFRRLRSVAEFVEGDALPTDEARVRLVADDGGPVAADVLGRRLFYLLESIENARALLNQAAGTDGKFHDRAFPARISYVQMDSPLEIVLVLPLGVLSVVALVWGGLKHLPVAYRTVQDGQLSKAQARSANADAESKELDNVVKKTQVKRFLERLATEIGANADIEHADQRQLDQTLVQLEESLGQLNAQDVTELELPAAVDPDRMSEPSKDGVQSPKPDAVPES